MSRPFAADDATEISRRLGELRAEREAVLGCACEGGIGDRGEAVRLDNPACAVHGAPKPAAIEPPPPFEDSLTREARRAAMDALDRRIRAAVGRYRADTWRKLGGA